MALPSNEEFFGSLLPSPSISKITLQLSGNPPRRLNPHIDPPGETSTLGLTEGSERTSNPSNLNVLLNVTIKELARNLQNSWLSTLNNLQSTQGNSTQPLDLAGYVKIKVLQNTDAGLTEQILNSISTSTDPLDGLLDNSGGVKSQYDGKLDLEEKSLSDIVGDPTKSSVSVANQPAFFNIPYSLSFELLKKNPSYLCYFCWAELDLVALAGSFNFDAQSLGISAIRSKIKHQVVIRGGNTVKFVDVFKTPSGKIWEGDIRDEENNVAWAGEWFTPPGTARSSNPVWMGEWLKDGKKYQAASTGYHQMPDGTFMTDGVHRAGLSEPIEKFLVTRERVTDIKIQDFRTSEKIDKLSLDFSILENKLKKDLPLAAKMRTANVSLESPVKYFSDISLTRDMSNNCRFLFSVDIASIMQNNSMFGNLFVKPTTKAECVTNTKILSMKLHRVRVKGSPEAGSSVLRGPSGKPKKFSEPSDLHGTVLTVQGQNSPVNNYTTDGDDLILEASYNNVGDLVSISRDGQGSVIQEELGINPSGDQEFIKFYSGTDMSVKHKTDGYYQYRLVLELEDGAVQYLVDSINQLNEAKLKLTEYYSQASKLGSSQIKTARTNPHIQQAYSQPENDQKPGFFDPATNRFTEEFRKFTSDPAPDGWRQTEGGGNNPPWISVAQTYVDIIFKLGDYGRPNPNERINLIDSLTNYMSPETGNIEGILKVFQLIDTLQDILSKEIGASTSAPDGLSSKPTNQNQNKRLTLSGKTVMAAPLETKDSTIPVTRVDYTFSNVFNSNLPKNVGIQVFPIGGVQGIQRVSPNLASSGLRKISKLDFETYVENEKAKIFNIQPNTTILLNFKIDNTMQTYGVTDVDYTYFTPSILKTEQQTINLNSDAGTPTVSEQAFGATQVIDSFGVSPETRKKSIELAALLTDYVADNYDLIVVPKVEPLPATSFQVGLISHIPPNRVDSYDASRSEASLNEKQAYGTFVKFLNAFKGKIKTDISLYDPTNANGYISRAGNNVSEVQKLPNQTKALFQYYADFQPGAQLSAGGDAIFADNITKIFTNGAFRGDENTKSAMRYLFETIFILECFTGYDLDSEGKPILVEKWEPLNRTNIGIINSDRLLCRLKRYENAPYGITVDRSSQLPLYEEYFIMEL